MNNKKLNACDLKKHNRASVFKYIYSHGRCTKQDIAYGLKLSLPTVSTALNSLLDDKLVANDGTAVSTGGRKAQYVNVNKDYRVFIGISITRNHQRFAAIDLAANITVSEIIRNDDDVSPKKLSDSLAKNLEGFIIRNGINKDKIYSVYIAYPGIISDNIIKFAPTLSYKDVKFSDIVKNIPYRCFAVNDADAGGFSEWWNSKGAGKNIIYLSVDKGIGGSIYLNSNKYSGNNSHSAEFGHMCIVPGGRKCSCKRKGCLEAYCSTSALSDDLNCTIEEFFEQIKANNPKFISILDSYLNFLSIGITNINTIFDAPIVIGGTLSRFSDCFLKSLKRKVQETAIFEENGDAITISKYTDMASCYGAALFGVNDVFISFQ